MNERAYHRDVDLVQVARGATRVSSLNAACYQLSMPCFLLSVDVEDNTCVKECSKNLYVLTPAPDATVLASTPLYLTS